MILPLHSEMFLGHPRWGRKPHQESLEFCYGRGILHLCSRSELLKASCFGNPRTEPQRETTLLLYAIDYRPDKLTQTLRCFWTCLGYVCMYWSCLLTRILDYRGWIYKNSLTKRSVPYLMQLFRMIVLRKPGSSLAEVIQSVNTK